MAHDNTDTPADLDALATTDPEVASLLAGEWMRYRKSPALMALTQASHAACARINAVFHEDIDEARRLFRELVPHTGQGVDFRAPVTIDYGMLLTIGDRTFINSDLLVVGGGRVSIGEDCLIGPRCAIYTPNHALDVPTRLAGWEKAAAVTLGNNVWLGGSVTLTPGVSIGDNSIIGAGSVVTHDIPANVIAAGNPCRVLRPLPAAGH